MKMEWFEPLRCCSTEPLIVRQIYLFNGLISRYNVILQAICLLLYFAQVGGDILSAELQEFSQTVHEAFTRQCTAEEKKTDPIDDISYCPDCYF